MLLTNHCSAEDEGVDLNHINLEAYNIAALSLQRKKAVKYLDVAVPDSISVTTRVLLASLMAISWAQLFRLMSM